MVSDSAPITTPCHGEPIKLQASNHAGHLVDFVCTAPGCTNVWNEDGYRFVAKRPRS